MNRHRCKKTKICAIGSKLETADVFFSNLFIENYVAQKLQKQHVYSEAEVGNSGVVGVLGIGNGLAVQWAGVQHGVSASLSNEVGNLSVEVLNLWHVEELVNSVNEADAWVLHEVVGWVADEPGQVHDFPVVTVLEALGEPAVVAPTHEAA